MLHSCRASVKVISWWSSSYWSHSLPQPGGFQYPCFTPANICMTHASLTFTLLSAFFIISVVLLILVFIFTRLGLHVSFLSPMSIGGGVSWLSLLQWWLLGLLRRQYYFLVLQTTGYHFQIQCRSRISRGGQCYLLRLVGYETFFMSFIVLEIRWLLFTVSILVSCRFRPILHNINEWNT